MLNEVSAVLEGRSRWCVLKGDSLSLLADLPDNCIDAVITDAPYSSGGVHSTDRFKTPTQKYVQSGQALQRPDFLGDNRDQYSFLAWCALWLGQAWRVSKEGAPVCLFSDWRQTPVTALALQAGGFLWRGLAVWDKTRATRPQPGRFRQQAEFVVWGSKGSMPADRGVPVLDGVWSVRADPREKRHITGKTPACMDNVVPICAPGGIILDPFFGAGSTGISALRAGYRVIGIELSAEYHQTSIECMEAEERGLALPPGPVISAAPARASRRRPPARAA